MYNYSKSTYKGVHMDIQKEYNYEDVFLVPQKCIVNSRSECDISMELGGRTFRNPVIPANMLSVCNFKTCEFLADIGMFYIMHRFGITLPDIIEFSDHMHSKNLFTSISVGINQESRTLIQNLYAHGIPLEYITIDVANAYSQNVVDMSKFIKDYYSNCVLIVGNICTPEAVEFLQSTYDKSVDLIKIGVAGGFVCSTKNTTGFHRRMVSTMIDCGKVAEVPLIADGSIKEVGHINIALNTSHKTQWVMCGNLFAGFEESNGDVLVIDDKPFKEYYGNASEKTKKNKKHVEGVCKLIPFKGDMIHFIEQMEDGIRSGVSYAGKDNVEDFYGIPMITYNRG
jgi:GMP reductase